MKSVILIISACMIILLLPAVLLSINEFRMTEYEEPHIITTAAEVTTSDITLSQELFSGETYNAVVTSNITADAPIPSSYVSSTQVLTVTGLEADNSRTLTITYEIDALNDYIGAGLGATIWPIMLVLGVIGIIVAAVYQATRRND